MKLSIRSVLLGLLASLVLVTSCAAPVSSPAPSPLPPASSNVSPSPSPSTTVPDLTLQIVSVTSPVSPGAQATLMAKTAPGAECTISVYYGSGKSSASGLGPKIADSDGNVSWTWKVGTKTEEGPYRIVVTTTSQGKTVSAETYFTVK